MAEYNVWADIWPDADKGTPIAPVRVGVDRRSGRMLVGWPHVKQSSAVLLTTRYHQRVLRYWVGSFVPHLLGRNAVVSTVTRFFWAIGTAFALWEPGYKITRIRVMQKDASVNGQQVSLTSADELRRGQISFQNEGSYIPRGHLGDDTPADNKIMGVLGPNNTWGS